MTRPAVMTTRERLIDSTVALLEEGGYAAASVGAITSRSGVAAGTLYRHFASKEALFVEVFREVCGREEAAMRAAGESHAEFGRRLDAVVDAFARRALRNPRLAWALLAEPVDPLVDAERLAFRGRYRALIATVLEDGVRQRATARLDPDLTAAALVGAIGEALVGPLAPTGGAENADALIADLQAFCRRAVGAG